MAEIGYFLASEEHGPNELVRQAQQAEAAGFRSVWISDHYHPWNDSQGQSPFVWSVIGGIAATTSLKVTTGVTCPTVRIHPAILAQAAATAAPPASATATSAPRPTGSRWTATSSRAARGSSRAA
jgi:G6PDH family F420-dependent oxidoreductase